jgi:WD40 repeat protein
MTTTTTTTDEGDTQPCFSSMQSRKFWAPPCSEVCQLCPSMDLVVLGLEGNHTNTNTNNNGQAEAAAAAAASTLWIHRAISWQKLATLPFHDNPATRCVWSPDGRQLAVACANNQVQLFGVESLSNPPATMGAASTTPNHVLEFQWPEQQQQQIVGLSWAHVGRPHPTAWTLTEEEREAQVSWRYVL